MYAFINKKLTNGISLVNKIQNELYHYFSEPNNVILVPVFKNKFILVKQKREPINKKTLNFQWAGSIKVKLLSLHPKGS